MVHNNHLFLRVGPLSVRLWKVSVPHTEGSPIAFVISGAQWEMHLLDQRRVGKRQPRIILTPWWVKARGMRA